MKFQKPTLILNKSVCKQNIELMAEKAKRHHLRFRPHFKTHQSIEIGRWFRQVGVEQITVSSVGMANYFANDGWKDITIAFPFNIHEIQDLNSLLLKSKINILVDNPEVVLSLENTLLGKVGAYIEISTGYNRSGIPENEISKIDMLIDAIELNGKLYFKGFLTHAGQTYQAKSQDEILNIHLDSVQKMNSLKSRYSKQFPQLEISVGDTPSCTLSEYFTGVDEIRPGNFVFYDLMQHQLGVCRIDDIAVRMACPVVSKQCHLNEIVVYGGAIHFSKDWIPKGDSSPLYGRIVRVNANNEKTLLDSSNYLCRLSQEHGVIKVTPDVFNLIEIGDMLEIIPVHSCLTLHAMGQMVTTKGEVIEIMDRF